jgi:MFS family permease
MAQLAVVFLVYNACAFLGPIVMATFVDHQQGRQWAGLLPWLGLAGALLVAASPVLNGHGIVLAVIMGLGSAAFHTMAGAATLAVKPGSGLAVGIFEAPGALGLAGGLATGAAVAGRPVEAWVSVGILAAMVVTGLAVWRFVRLPGTDMPTSLGGIAGAGAVAVTPIAWPLAALAVASVLRALNGSAVNQPAVGRGAWLVAAGAAVALGRALGGLAGDRFGHRRVAVTGLAAGGAAALVLPPGLAMAVVAGLLVALPMAPLLAGLARVLPGREALAFGAAQAFQFPVAILAWGSNKWLVVGLAAVAATAALVGLASKPAWAAAGSRAVQPALKDVS